MVIAATIQFHASRGYQIKHPRRKHFKCQETGNSSSTAVGGE